MTGSAQVAACVRAWRVGVEQVTETATSILVFGVSDGRSVVLKVLKHPSDEWHSGAILDAFEGQGSVRVYEQTAGAMLLERASPGYALVPTVVAGADDEATRILAEVIAKMSPRIPPPGTPTAEDWGAGFDRYIASGDSEIPERLVREARRLYFDLCASQQRVRLLHGDLHHGNVVHDATRGWLAIDAKGVVGELEYECGAVLRNPWELRELFTRPATIAARVRSFARELSLDAGRIRGWAGAQAVLSAIWTIEDGLEADARSGPLALLTAITGMRDWR
jgi:streptomycin 6-kinase